MIRPAVILLCLSAFAAPAFADPESIAPTEPPKTKKVCKTKNSGDPLHPYITCRSVPVVPKVAAAPAAQPAATQVAQNAQTPQP